MTDLRTSRRTLLKAVGPVLLRATGLVTVQAAGAGGCARDPDAVEVVVMWSGGELGAFRAVVNEFSRESGRPVRIVPVGEQVHELLQARLDADNPPDVAVVPLPGLIKAYAREHRVMPIDPALAEGVPKDLLESVTVDGELFGLWVKAAHKSLFWYRPSTLAGTAPPGTWSDLLAIVRTMALSSRAPLSIGAADGWVVTDWFENVLAGLDGGEVYRQLARGENQWRSDVVRKALARLGEAWSIAGAFPDGPARALLTQFEESVFDVFTNDRAGMVFEGDFVAAVVERLRRAGRLPESPLVFRFPATDGPPPLVVGGDVAARMTESPGSRELIQWLARPGSLDSWIKRGGFLSPNLNTPPDRYPTPLARMLAAEIRTEKVHFDLSDQLTGRLSSSQGRGLAQILTEFFAAVSVPGGDRSALIERVQAQLADAAEWDLPRVQEARY